MSLDKLKTVYIRNQEYLVQQARVHKNQYLLMLSGVDNLTAAESFRTAEVFIKEKLVDTEIYREEIIGKKVYDQTDQEIGIVQEVMYTDFQNTLVVKNEKKQEKLIPWVDKFVLEISDCVRVDLSDLEEYRD